MSSAQPASASTTDLLGCRFGPAQVFDVQWNISGGSLNVSGITRPYASDGQLSVAELDSSDYFRFANSTNGSDPSLSFTQYSSADSVKRTLHTWGNFRAIGEDFIFYTGTGFYGTVITTGEGFNYGQSASLAITAENPPLESVLAYSSCSPTPLAAGVRRAESGGSEGPAESAPLANEPAIGLDLRAVVGGRPDAARIDIIGLHLPVETTYLLTIYSPTRTLISGVVGGNGSFSGLIPVPQDLGEGTFTSLGQSMVGPVVVDPKLAHTGVQASALPLWALTSLFLGLALVLYSVRARRIVELAESTAPETITRTPWEILRTPIRVPGIDYLSGNATDEAAASLTEAMKELDLAFSRMIVIRMDSLQAHFSLR